jgi:hypothetical protein
VKAREGVKAQRGMAGSETNLLAEPQTVEPLGATFGYGNSVVSLVAPFAHFRAAQRRRRVRQSAQ